MAARGYVYQIQTIKKILKQTNENCEETLPIYNYLKLVQIELQMKEKLFKNDPHKFKISLKEYAHHNLEKMVEDLFEPVKKELAEEAKKCLKDINTFLKELTYNYGSHHLNKISYPYLRYVDCYDEETQKMCEEAKKYLENISEERKKFEELLKGIL